jgi:hypothetical protein
VLEVVAIYKDLSEVERGFRQLKDVLAMRPIYHQIESRVKAHIFVAALALLVQRLLARRLKEAGIDFSAERAMEALEIEVWRRLPGETSSRNRDAGRRDPSATSNGRARVPETLNRRASS